VDGYTYVVEREENVLARCGGAIWSC